MLRNDEFVCAAPSDVGGYGLQRATTAGYQLDHNNPRYRCLCGSMHVTTGATLIAAISTTTIILNLLMVIYTVDDDSLSSTIVLGLVPFIIVMLLAGLLVRGVRTHQAGHMIPFIVVQIIQLIVCIYAVLNVIVLVIADPSTSLILLFVAFGLQLIVHIAFLHVLYRCFYYLRAVRLSLAQRNVVYYHQNQQQQPIANYYMPQQPPPTYSPYVVAPSANNPSQPLMHMAPPAYSIATLVPEQQNAPKCP